VRFGAGRVASSGFLFSDPRLLAPHVALSRALADPSPNIRTFDRRSFRRLLQA